ncbi:MAG: carboxypeptidase regulatory-like domain-containing protein [Acidobacteria bacterium]|nr:carboxypeptidase regulatory-like domain-containing protein [Acidobacteriota bacterium]
MTKNNIIKFVAGVAFSLMLMVGSAFAQASGNIAGVVSDSTGAVVPNATVKLISKSTGLEKTTTSSNDGIYNFTLLQPGRFTVTVTSGSFAAQSLDVEVQVGRTTDANFTLGAGGVSAVVEVTAEGIQTTQSNSDAVINETGISNLPINGRRFQDFVTLTPPLRLRGHGPDLASGQKGHKRQRQCRRRGL